MWKQKESWGKPSFLFEVIYKAKGEGKMSFTEVMFQGERYKNILVGLQWTLVITLFAGLIGVLFGIVLALINISNRRWIKKIAGVYIDIVRGTPVMVQLLIIHFVLVRPDSPVVSAIIGFGLNSAAYVSEIIRAGINSIDKGQMEAARSLGMPYSLAMRYIIMPQAVKNILPALVNEFIALIKETSIVGLIGAVDLVRGSMIISSRTYNYAYPLMVITVIYFVLTTSFSKLVKLLERKMENDQSKKSA